MIKLKQIILGLSILCLVLSSENQNKQLNIYVNNIAPLDNPSETYKYYTLPFIRPKEEIKSDQTFSQSLSGDRIYHSPYNSIIGQDVTETLGSRNYTKQELQQFIDAIENVFYAEFYVEQFVVHDLIGKFEQDENGTLSYYLKTYIQFNVYLDKSQSKDNPVILYANITNFYDTNLDGLYYQQIPSFRDGEEQEEIQFFYSVFYYYANIQDIDYEKDNVFDSQDQQESDQNPQIHWFSIILSFLLVVLLVLLVCLVLARILKKDFSLSSDIESDYSVEIGWKLIRTEALMPPVHKLILSGFLGNGLQFIFLVINLIFFGILGLYYNSQKGNLKQVGVFLYSFTGIFNGYYSAKYYKYFGGKHWALNFIFSCGLFPFSLLLVFSIVNSYAWYKQSTSAIPAEAVFLVILIFLIIFVPLTLAGTITSRVKTSESLPNVGSSMPRLYKPVPKKKMYQTAFIHFLIGGLLPFSSIYLELKQIFNSIWGHQTYHLYGIICIAFVLFLAVQACVSIGLTYYQLNAMDYNWWWKSFSYGGSTSIFIGLYVIFYYWKVSTMHGTLQFLMYFGYMILFCIVLFMMLGSVSFLASLKFVRYIYNNGKMD
ncbi:hypothetical protein ABPG72_010371 [Tetrahymena utriculariae]